MLTSYHFISAYMQARFSDDERGASLVEYALLVALIAVVAIIALRAIGTGASEQLQSVADEITP